MQHLSSPLKKDATWSWRPENQAAFDAVKKSLASASVLILSDDPKPFHVVFDASDFAIGCAFIQFDDEGLKQAASYQSRQMKPEEKKYSAHDKKLLALRYALITFRVHLLGERTFDLYVDHASLRSAIGFRIFLNGWHAGFPFFPYTTSSCITNRERLTFLPMHCRTIPTAILGLH